MQMVNDIEKDECLPWLHLVKLQARILPSLTPALNCLIGPGKEIYSIFSWCWWARI